MEVVLVLIVIVAAIGWVMSAQTKIETQRPAEAPTGPRVRMTDHQTVCLSCASSDVPIYSERPSLRFAQMPNDAKCFPLRTVESLEKRGYLRSDGSGGYLITAEGEKALRSAMGF